MEFLALFFCRLEFSPHLSEHLNCGPILTNIRILILSFHCKHWNSALILPNKGILVPLFTHIVFFISSFKTLGFWPYLKTSEFWPYILHIALWSHPSKHLNSGPIFINIGIFILSFHCNHWNSRPTCILPAVGILAQF